MHDATWISRRSARLSVVLVPYTRFLPRKVIAELFGITTGRRTRCSHVLRVGPAQLLQLSNAPRLWVLCRDSDRSRDPIYSLPSFTPSAESRPPVPAAQDRSEGLLFESEVFE